MEEYDPTTLSLLLVSGALIAVVYEWYAVKTNRLPTITEIVKKGGWPARIAFVVAFSLAMVDHFITGWVL